MVEVRRYRDDYIVADEGWRRVTGDEGTHGVWALRYDDHAPWTWKVAVGIVSVAPHWSPTSAQLEASLRSLPGVVDVRPVRPGEWEVRGDPSGEALVRVLSELIESSVAAACAQPDPVKATVKLIVQGLRSRGFQGRQPKVRRVRPTGSLEIAVVGQELRRSTVWVDLNFVPAVLLQVWREADHWMLPHAERGGVDVGFSVRIGHLDGIPSGEHHVDRSSPGRTAGDVLDRFDSLGAAWFDLFREGDATVPTTSLPARSRQRFGTAPFLPAQNLAALAAHLMSGPRDPAAASVVLGDLRAETERVRGLVGDSASSSPHAPDLAVLERLSELLGR